MFGRYPFAGVANDFVYISRLFDRPREMWGMSASGPLFTFWGLLSLPIDLVVDTLASPLDCIAWANGVEKGYHPRYVEQEGGKPHHGK